MRNSDKFADGDYLVRTKLNKAWKQASRVILGGEVGELDDFENFLTRYRQSITSYISKLSGKIVRTLDIYSKDASMIGYNEVDSLANMPPVSINEIKDIDSLRNAVEERFTYIGGGLLGNTRFVAGSTNINNSYYVQNSINIFNSKYVAYSSYSDRTSYIFGSNDANGVNFSINVDASGVDHPTREFESHFIIEGSSDIYYGMYIVASHECMFSFFQRGKQFCIGNLVLDKDKYFQVKASLLEQIRQELRNKKTIFGLYDLVGSFSEDQELEYLKYDEIVQPSVENAFRKTTKTILGKSLKNLVDYKQYLSNNPLYKLGVVRSAISDNPVIISCEEYYKLPVKAISRSIAEADFSIVSKRHIKKITSDLHELVRQLKDIAYLSMDLQIMYPDTIRSSICYKSHDNYETVMPVFSNYTAYSFWPRNSDYTFGSSTMFKSLGVIRSYNSDNIKRGFEVDFCRGSSDIYFSHNVENSSNVMFSFGLKSLHNAVLNTEFSETEYNRVKSNILDWVYTNLSSKHTLDLGVLNL